MSEDKTGPLTEAEIDKFVGQRIRERRRIMRITQMQLGEAIGVRFQQIQKYETGTNRVSASKLFLICEFLQADMTYFFSGLPSMHALSGAPDPTAARDPVEADMLTAMRSMSDVARVNVTSIARDMAKMQAENGRRHDA